jgi:HSP20 family protein
MTQQITPRREQGGTMTRRPRHPLDLFQRELDMLLDHFFGGWPIMFENGGEMRRWDFNVTDNDKEIVVRADMPGFDEKELDIRLEGDVLTIRAEKEQKGDGSQEYRSFFRSVTLPARVDADKVQASYHNGVLELHFPRPEGSRPRRIPVRGQAALTEKPASEGTGSQAATQEGKK